jgi:hypothetical protein
MLAAAESPYLWRRRDWPALQPGQARSLLADLDAFCRRAARGLSRRAVPQALAVTRSGHLAMADAQDICVHLISLETGAYVRRLYDPEVPLSHVGAVAATADGLLWVSGITRTEREGHERAHLFCVAQDGEVLVRVDLNYVVHARALLVMPCGDLLMLSAEVLMRWSVHPPGVRVHTARPMRAPIRQPLRSSVHLFRAVDMALLSPTVLAIAENLSPEDQQSTIQISSLEDDCLNLLRVIRLDPAAAPMRIAVTPDGFLVVLEVDVRFPGGDPWARNGAATVSFWTLTGERIAALNSEDIARHTMRFAERHKAVRFRALAVAPDGRLLLAHYGHVVRGANQRVSAAGVVVF